MIRRMGWVEGNEPKEKARNQIKKLSNTDYLDITLLITSLPCFLNRKLGALAHTINH